MSTRDAPATPVVYETSPERYKHWSLKFEGPVATLVMAIDEDGWRGWGIAGAHGSLLK